MMLLLGWGLFAGPLYGQRVSGSFSLTGTAGYQSNLYLDPVIGEWNPGVTPAFFAVDPSVALAYSTPSLQLGVTGMMRTYPRRIDGSPLPLMRVSGTGRYIMSRHWTVKMSSGLSRYRLDAERDMWWALPALAWHPTRQTKLEGRAGLASRHTMFESGLSSRQTSAVGVLTGSTWLADRLQGQLSVYLSNSRTTTSETTYGGTGLTLGTTYWWTDRLALTGHAAFEQISYEITQETEEGPPIDIGGPPGGGATTTASFSDQLWRAGAEVRWTMGSGVTLFARAQGMYADLEQSGTTTLDGHLGGGLRLQLDHTFVQSDRIVRPRGLWRNTESGIRFRVPYRGDGQLYVTGDFNNWADPGIPMHRARSHRYVATLSLEPGRYEYRIRVVEGDGETRWLELPDEARTVRDGFGGVNGVCIVE